MLFQTKYTHEKSPGEVNLGKNLVEKAGYIPAQARIENMILAGQRLVEHRKEMYDFSDAKDIDESFTDPTRSKNYDMSDAFIMSEVIKNNVRQKELLKASQAAQEGSGAVQEGSGAVQKGSGAVQKGDGGENNPPES